MISLTVEGQYRFRVEQFSQIAPLHVASIRLLDEPDADAQDLDPPSKCSKTH